MSQPLPRRIQALFPGETIRAGYTFFRDHASRPYDFENQEPGARANAWWCSQLALLSYVDAKDIRPKLESASLTLVGQIIDVNDLRAVVAVSDDGHTVFVSFRGTVLPAPAWPISPGESQAAANNWAHNLTAQPVATPPPAAGMVHKGFEEGWRKLRTGVEDALVAIPGKHVVVWTGHSLGGALATVAAALSTLPQNCRSVIVTFGSPRVGDPQFVDSLKVPHARFVLGSDAVPGLPPPNKTGFSAFPSYVHHGTKIPLTYNSPIFDGAEVVDLIDHEMGISETNKIAAILELAAIPVPLRDHAMLLYAAKCS